jgi:hypothetical protein
MSVTKPLHEMTVVEFLREVREWGCTCDVMAGWSCGHSRILNEIERRIGLRPVDTAPKT